MSLPWLTQPVMLHSSRDAGTCTMTPQQCAFKTQHWVFWYNADNVYALNTVYFFVAVIGIFAVGYGLPKVLGKNGLYLRMLAATRLLSYRQLRGKRLDWGFPSVGILLLGLVGAAFFLAMTLGPQPYYWPNTKTISFGNSPPLATRTGWMGLGCLPFVIALSTKANMITALTGISYEKLHVFHSWAAWAMFVLALVHTFPFIIYHQWKGDIVSQWSQGGVWVTGVIALIAQAWLTLMSFPFIRNRYYEFFKATHLLAAAAFVVFFFIHCDFRLSSWDYFIATGVIYALSLLYAHIRTFLLRGVQHAELIPETDHTLRINIGTASTWRPGQHVFLRFLTLGVHSMTAHPFTICSAPSVRSTESKRDNGNDGASTMVFYIKPRGGITGRLANLARLQPGVKLAALLEGPYGGVPDRWAMGFDEALVIVGGSGAGFSLALIEDWMTNRHRRDTQQLHILVSTRDPNMRAWYLEALARIASKNAFSTAIGGLDITIHETGPQPGGGHSGQSASSVDKEGNEKDITKITDSTAKDSGAALLELFQVTFKASRPDVRAAIHRVASSTGGSIGIAACGPPSMSYDVSVEAANIQKRILCGGEGLSEVWYHQEAFSY
ncbi:ferric reductase [Diplogelasinospora grovesii]|uniref:ferric-chelate reductase (NADPH) n=1 Tax=Diplogelasinospora grovesii TaxID=303347 RepID=A0AAN6MXF2_9PEZI|nr:ferric reductase [Diplogelasinospora grovesii]